MGITTTHPAGDLNPPINVLTDNYQFFTASNSRQEEKLSSVVPD